MRRLYGDRAVEAFTDLDVDIIADAVNYGTQIVNMYLIEQYDPAQLCTSILIRRWATIVACNYLSSLRGNPEQYYEMSQDVDQKLQKMQMNKLRVPGLAPRSGNIPYVSTPLVDLRYSSRQVRVNPIASTGNPYPMQPMANVYGPTEFE